MSTLSSLAGHWKCHSGRSFHSTSGMYSNRRKWHLGRESQSAAGRGSSSLLGLEDNRY